MTIYVIDTVEMTLSIGNDAPQVVESVEEACEMIEQAEGVEEPAGDEAAQMQAGFDKARGSTAGMLGG